MILYAKGVKAAKEGQTFEEGGVLVFPVVDTTMRIGNSRIKDGIARDGETLIALRQTHGVSGTPGRPWVSGEGNLLMSRILKLEAGEIGHFIGIMASLSARDVIRDLLPQSDVYVRSPNDIMVDGRKIGGSLVEDFYDLDAARLVSRLINIGFSVNLCTAPNVVQKTACLAEYGCKIEIADFIEAFDEKFENLLERFREKHDFNVILDHMEVLWPDGSVCLEQRESQNFQFGKYAGFRVVEELAETKFFIRLRDGDSLSEHRVPKHFFRRVPSAMQPMSHDTERLAHAVPR